jgi:hypothetical protein
MAKSSKKSKEATAPDLTPASAPGMDKPVAGQASSARPAGAKEQPKAAGKRARGAAGKTAGARKPRTATRKTRSAKPVVISDEDIRIRAYFISEQRRQRGIAGGSARDWLEARRQLQEEAGKNA